MHAPMNKVAVVTGASRGIGRAVAERLARAGVQVVVNYARDHERANAVAAGIVAAGGKAIAVQADVSCPRAALTLVERAVTGRSAMQCFISHRFPGPRWLRTKGWRANYVR